MLLRWKLHPRETGLRAVCAGPRGSDYHDGKKIYAKVQALGGGGRLTVGWFWVAGWDSGIPHKNTSRTPVATADEAKAQAMAYVKEHLVAQRAQADQKGGA